MLTDEGDETRRIRDNVILMQVPVINPDGLDMVVDWYRKNLGTPYELAPLPMLYQKYAGHDNNRDWFMMNLQETRNVASCCSRNGSRRSCTTSTRRRHSRADLRSALRRAAEPEYSRARDGGHQPDRRRPSRSASRGRTSPACFPITASMRWWNGGLRSAAGLSQHARNPDRNGGARVRDTACLRAVRRSRSASATASRRKEPTIFYRAAVDGRTLGPARRRSITC